MIDGDSINWFTRIAVIWFFIYFPLGLLMGGVIGHLWATQKPKRKKNGNGKNGNPKGSK